MASSIVASVARQLGGLLFEEAKDLYAVRDKVENLQIELEWIECFLEDADNRQHQEKVVQKWVSQIRDFAYDAEDTIEKYLHQVSYHRKKGNWNTFKWFSCCVGDVLTLHDVGLNIDDLRNKISEMIRRMQLYGIQVTRQPESSRCNLLMREERRTYSHIDEDPIGLEEHIEKVVIKLVDDTEAKVVGISGMGGLGKTTLARKVFSNIAVKEHFKSNSIWIYISKEFGRRNVFEEILVGLSSAYGEQGGKNVGELRDEELPRKICEIFEEKDCLVVLDDIWTTRAWDTLKPAFQSIKSSGSKILITTRNRGLVQHADPCGYSHPFGLLNEADSWKLLQQKAFPEQENPAVSVAVKAKMLGLAKEMLKHCNGLPLAILALGGILVTRKTLGEWETIHKNVTSFLISDIGQESGAERVSRVLELSYYDLPFYLKPCFMYLGSFPEDFEIPTQRLYHLWEAEALVTVWTETQGAVSIDDLAEYYLYQLVERCMVQVEKRWPNGRIKSCRLHDVMRDMCLKKCKDVNFLHTIECGNSEEPSNYTVSSSHTNRKLRRCAIYSRGGVIPDSLLDIHLDEGPSIRSLLVFPHSLHEEMNMCSINARSSFSLIRVLDLGGACIGNFSEALGYFIHLRYLSLRETVFSGLPLCIWSNCKYLETLDLRSRMSFYLSNDFSKLEKLRHLYLPLPHFMQLKGPGKLILSPNQLKQMETLKNFNAEYCKVEDLAKMVNLRIFSRKGQLLDRKDLDSFLNTPMITTERLINPLRLHIKAEVINEEPEVLKTIRSHVCIRGLNVSGRIDVPFDSNVKIFPTSLTRVVLVDSEVDKGGIFVLEKLPCLNQLGLCNKAIKESKMSFSDGGFPQLASLFLDYIENLEEWEVGKGALPNLQILQIVQCKLLKMIPEGLPSSIKIKCFPCINGNQNYTCLCRPRVEEQQPSSTSVTDSKHSMLLSCCS